MPLISQYGYYTWVGLIGVVVFLTNVLGCHRLEHQRCLDRFGFCNPWLALLLLTVVMFENVDALGWNLIARYRVGSFFILTLPSIPPTFSQIMRPIRGRAVNDETS